MGIRCEVCGGTRIIKQSDLFVCQECGVSYSLEDMRKMLTPNQQINATYPVEKSGCRDVTLQKGDLVFYGDYQYYSDDEDEYPIEWIILEDRSDELVLISRDLIDFVQFNTYEQHRTDIPPVLDSEGVYRYVWHNSSIREWLNKDFYEIAFDDEEKKGIYSVRNAFPRFSITDSCRQAPNSSEPLPDVFDKVFLPSEKDIEKWQKVIRTRSRYIKLKPTPYASSKDVNPGAYEYWSRNQAIRSRKNNARVIGNMLDEDATAYCYLRIMIHVDRNDLQTMIEDYDDDFYSYYQKCNKEFKEENKKAQELFAKVDIDKIVSEPIIVEGDNNPYISEYRTEAMVDKEKDNNEKDSYIDEGLGFYDGKYYTEESWRETHSNPWGTEDVGDGYIDSDGNYTEY